MQKPSSTRGRPAGDREPDGDQRAGLTALDIVCHRQRGVRDHRQERARGEPYAKAPVSQLAGSNGT